MSSEVEYVLDRLESVADSQPADHPLYRVNRGTSQVYETGEQIDTTEPIPKRKDDLQRANFVSVAQTDSGSDPRGQHYNLDTSVTVNVRIVGLHWLEGGHIDPEGEKGVTFDTLKNDIRGRILADRTYPDVPGSDTYRHILILSEMDATSEFRDFYAHELNFNFDKVETL